MPYLKLGDAKVGNGATYCMYSDRIACTIIKVTAKTITLQEDKAIQLTDPVIIPGGFAGHCINNNDIKYSYERDLMGSVKVARWSAKQQKYIVDGYAPVIAGRHKFYDYNF
jgi:hypothetical protein